MQRCAEQLYSGVSSANLHKKEASGLPEGLLSRHSYKAELLITSRYAGCFKEAERIAAIANSSFLILILHTPKDILKCNKSP